MLKVKKSTVISGQLIECDIKLADDCKNGHADFSLTGTMYYGTKRGDSNINICGCIHDEILYAFPELEIFAKLHLSDFFGVPMYAVENGMYHLKNGTKDVAINYLRLVNNDEYEQLLAAANCEDTQYFKLILENLGITERWNNEAIKAKTELCKMLDKDIDYWTTLDFGKSRYVHLTNDERTELYKKVNSGYYSNESIQARIDQKHVDLLNKKREELRLGAIKSEQKLLKSNEIDLFMFEKLHEFKKLNQGVKIGSWIFYHHLNTICFNWSHEKTEQSVFDMFADFVGDQLEVINEKYKHYKNCTFTTPHGENNLTLKFTK